MLTRRTKRFFRRFFTAIVWLLFFVTVTLWRFHNSLPEFAIRYLERKLSEGVVSFHFDKASFNIFNGIIFHDTRVHFKRVMGDPVFRAEELRFNWQIDFEKPLHTWIRGIYAENLILEPFSELPASPDRSEDSDLGALFRDISSGYDWSLTPCHIVLQNSKIFSVDCKFAEFDLYIRSSKLFLDNLRIVPNSVGYVEMIQGEVEFDAADSTIHSLLYGTITPDVLRDLVLFLEGDTAVKIFDNISKISSPFNVSAEITWILSDSDLPSRQDVRLSVRGSDFYYRDHPVKSGRLSMQWIVDPADSGDYGKRMILSPIIVNFTDGSLEGKIARYLRAGVMDITASSTLPPLSFFKVLGIKTPKVIREDFVFRTSPSVSVNGRIYSEGSDKKDLIWGEITDVDFSVFDFELSRATAGWSTDADHVFSFNDIDAECYGGKVSGDVEIDIGTEDDDEGLLKTELLFTKVSSDSLRRYFNKDLPPSGGLFDGEIKLVSTVNTNTLANLSGSAKLSAKNGAFLRSPLFGGLTDFIGRNVPGMDLLLMQSDFESCLTATNGLVTEES